MTNQTKIYDLEARTKKFGFDCLTFVNKLQRNAVTNPLILQLVRSATSVGANYLEADEAPSRKDFMYKLSLCKKEARETIHWFDMLAHVLPEAAIASISLRQEAQELVLIFGSILRQK